MALLSIQRAWLRCGLVFALIAAFVGSLGLPQVGTLHHDHPGGEHAHVHPELVIVPFVSPHHHHDEADHHHTHDQTAHSNEDDFHHSQPYPPTITEAGVHADFVYADGDAVGIGHWHTYKIVPCAGLTHVPPLPFTLLCLPAAIAIQTLAFTAALTAFLPRAPPLLL